MEPPKTAKIEIPEIRAQILRREDDERRGAGAGLLTKLGLGGPSGPGGAGGFATGGGLLAGKAGIVAFIVAGSSVAAGVGGLLTMSGNNANVVHPAGVFAKADGGSASDSAEASANAAAAPAGTVSSSLDNFHEANRGAVPDPYAPAKPETVNDAAGPAQVAGSASAVPNNSTTQSPGTTPPAPRPRMVKGAGFGDSAIASGGSGAVSGGGQLASAGAPGAVSNLSRMTNGGTSALRAERGLAGAQRRSAITNGFNGATSQLLAHSSALRSNLGSGAVSSQASGAVMDGAAPAGNIGPGGGHITGGGAGTGGKGIDSSPGQSVSNNLRQVQPPPPPTNNGQNKTPYQKTMTMAMIALMVGGALLMIAGLLKKAKNPHTEAMAKYVALLAAAAAAAATALGFVLFSKYGQTMQGMMIMGLGGITTFFAAKMAYDDYAADEAKAAQAKTLEQSQETMKAMGAKGYTAVPGHDGLMFNQSTGQYIQVNGSSYTNMVPAQSTPNLVPQGAPINVPPAPPPPPPPPPPPTTTGVNGQPLPVSSEPPAFIPPSF